MERRYSTAGRKEFLRKAIVSSLTLWLLVGGVHLLQAEQAGESSFVMLPDGTPRFTQVLRWQGEANVLYYDITVQTASGKTIITSRVKKPELAFSLGPGNYRYRIVLYNLLRQAAITLPWQEFVVLRARMPHIASATPTKWFVPDPNLIAAISGDRLMSGATVALKRENGQKHSVIGREVGRDGTSSVKVEFSSKDLLAGEYAITITNPGGLSFTFPHAIVVRQKLPPPSKLEPATGAVYGPDQLRGVKSIRFTWAPVPGAAKYTFCLYKGADTKPLIRVDSLTDCVYVLKNLSILDNGSFHWTVNPQGNDPALGVIPSVRPAEATFAIHLPALAAPVLKAGSIFYGR